MSMAIRSALPADLTGTIFAERAECIHDHCPQGGMARVGKEGTLPGGYRPFRGTDSLGSGGSTREVPSEIGHSWE